MRKATIETVIKTLNDAGVRYLVAGGLAVVAHGYVRLTSDLDLVVALDGQNVLRAVEALATQGYRPRVPVEARHLADPAHRESWRRDKHMAVFSLLSEEHPETPIDIFVDIPFDFGAEYTQACWLPLADGVDVPFVSLDQLISMKETTGRPQDQLDVHHLRRIRDGLPG